MKCPNCQTENLPISRFCVKCNKPLRISRRTPAPLHADKIPDIQLEKEPDIKAKKAAPKKPKSTDKTPEKPAPEVPKSVAKPPEQPDPGIRKPEVKPEEMPAPVVKKPEMKPEQKPVSEGIKPGVKPGEKPAPEVKKQDIRSGEKPILEIKASDTLPVGKSVPVKQKADIKAEERPKAKPDENQTEAADSQIIRLDRSEDKAGKKQAEEGTQKGSKTAPVPKPEKAAPPPPSHKKVKKRGPLLLLAAFLAVVILGIIIWMLFLKGAPENEAPAPVPDTPSLAVLYFGNQTGDPRFNKWNQAFAHALINYLKQIKQIRVLSAERLFAILNRLELLDSQGYSSQDFQRIASLSGANFLLSGKLNRSGDNYQLSAALIQSASGQEVFSENFQGKGESSILTHIAPLTNLISKNLIKTLSKSGIDSDSEASFESGSETAVRDFGPIDPDVYSQYVQGRIAHFQNDHRRSIEIMDQVMAADPGFALAAASKSQSLFDLGYMDGSWKASQRAQGLLEALSERDRLHLQGDFYRKSEKTYDIAVKVYKRLLEIYPGDDVGNTHLGLLYKNLQQWDLAEKCFQANRRHNVRTQNFYLGQAMLLAAQGKYDKAEAVLISYLKFSPGSEAIFLYQAALSLLQEKYSDALLRVKKGLSLFPRSSYCLPRIRGEIYLLTHDLKAAESEFQQLKNNTEPIAQLWGIRRMIDLHRLRGKFSSALREVLTGIRLANELGEMGWKYRFHMDLARMFLEAGRPQRVLQECDQAWNIAVQGETRGFPRETLMYKGMAYLLMNRGDDAMATNTELKALCEKGPVADQMRYYLLLEGNIALAKGNYFQAVDLATQAVALLPPQDLPWFFSNDHAYFLNFLAVAQTAARKTDDVLKTYERLTALTTGRIGFGAIYARNVYKLGKLYADSGAQEKAVAYLQRFATLWQEADPGNPELTDARRWMAALR